MSLLIKATLLSISRAERTRGDGTAIVLQEVVIEDVHHRKINAVIFYPCAQGVRLLKIGDNIEVGISTQTGKWVSEMGDVDIITENVIEYIERI